MSTTSPIRPATIGDTRSTYLVRLRCVLALWDEADLAALIAYRRAAWASSGEEPSMGRLMSAMQARDVLRSAYAGIVASPYPRPVVEHLQDEITTVRASAETDKPIDDDDRAERRRRLAWISAVITDAIERIEGRRGDDVALPVEVPA